MIRDISLTAAFFLTIILVTAGCDSKIDTDNEGNLVDPDFPCIDGLANEMYPCDRLDLYSVLAPEDLLGTQLNDIWGWTHEASGREFALIGLTDGVTFVEITEPGNPVVTGKLIESTESDHHQRTQYFDHRYSTLHDDYKGASLWRDMKVYENYVVVVSEEEGHGMQVFDLHRLLDVTEEESPVFFEHDALYMEFETAHNIAVNEETGYAFVVGTRVGSTCTNGGMHIVDIREPLNPQYAGCYLDERGGGVVSDGYIHDTQCVIYTGPDSRYAGEEICFNSSELKFLITNVSDKSEPSTISVSGYEGAAYSHQGWLTEDQQYFLMNDELDERRYGHPTRTYVWDVTNLENPELVGYHQFDINSIDHNLYIRGDYVYEANYMAGVRILRIVDLANAELEEAGFFDTTPGEMELEFRGTWSVFPWLSNNKVITSDMENGLFILRYNKP